MPALSIRPALPDDAAELGVIAPAAYAAAYSDLWVVSTDFAHQLDSFSARQFASLLEDPEHMILVATADGSLVGFLSMRFDTDEPISHAPGGAEVHRIYLLPQAQGLGLGQHLVLAAAHLAEKRGATYLWLSVFEHAACALRAYCRWGFMTIGTAHYQKPIRPECRRMAVLHATLDTICNSGPKITVQREPSRNVEPLRAFYERQGYIGQISRDAVLISARANGKLVGLVRIETEKGLRVLRGMNVNSLYQRQGIGSQMLRFLKPQLETACYCLPHRWLQDFYGSIGFVRQPDETAPPHLAQRLSDYHRRGEDPVLMFRPAGGVK